MSGIDAFDDAMENACSSDGAYFLRNGTGFSLPNTSSITRYRSVSAASPNRNVPNMPRTERMVSRPMVSIMEQMAQNTARGMTFMMRVVTLRNSSLKASKMFFTVSEYFPIRPAPTPHSTARKMSCSMFESRNAFRKLVGTTPTIMSLIETLIF